MHQPIDCNDERFYAAETLPIPNGKARRAAPGALCAARMGVGTLLMGGDHKGHAFKRDGQPTPQQCRTHRAPRTDAEGP
jgi:hypothetical protein